MSGCCSHAAVQVREDGWRHGASLTPRRPEETRSRCQALINSIAHGNCNFCAMLFCARHLTFAQIKYHLFFISSNNLNSFLHTHHLKLYFGSSFSLPVLLGDASDSIHHKAAAWVSHVISTLGVSSPVEQRQVSLASHWWASWGLRAFCR